MTVRWRHCAVAERDHKEDVRNYAHTFHYPQTICLCEAFWKLPREYRDGIILHEIGHLLAGPQSSEEEANQAAEKWSGTNIQYVDSPYGRHLERLMNMAGARVIRRSSNPVHHGYELPYDEWIPTHAVKFNSDGTVDVMTEHVPHLKNLGGYWECHGTAGDCDPGEAEEIGTWHPIRRSGGYRGSLTTDKPRTKRRR